MPPYQFCDGALLRGQAHLDRARIVKLIFYSCGMGMGCKSLIFQGSKGGFRKNVVPRFCVL
jgi:hypothetical protein